MRLLNIETLKLETFYGFDIPEYAILSHTWGPEEVTFQDLTTDILQEKEGWGKILGTIKEAKKQGCKYVWIDTCCIDKSSSAELSEAINSMFRWYQESKFCFAYLEDVVTGPGSVMTEPETHIATMKLLHRSRWFQRGWTLQELIAPNTVYFFDACWSHLGEKRQLEKDLEEITKIDADVLRQPQSLYTKSIARRMSWASARKTTRIEDIAYSLIGVFNVNMPLLYGEGGKAFIRLQEEIMRSTYDHSLFAWNPYYSDFSWGINHSMGEGPVVGTGLLARHPAAFRESANVIPRSTKTEPYAMTNRGLRLNLRLLRTDSENRVTPHSQTHLAVLQCSSWNDFGTAVAIPVIQISPPTASGFGGEYCRCVKESFVEVESSKAKDNLNINVYFRASGPLFQADMPHPVYHCWIRKWRSDFAFDFKGALYREDPKTWRDNLVYRAWNYESRSMTWEQAWHGVRAAILFLTGNESPLIVMLSFQHENYGARMGMDVALPRHTYNLSDPAPRQSLLREHLAGDRGFFIRNSSGSKQTVVLEDLSVTVEWKREIVFDEKLFVIDVSIQPTPRPSSPISYAVGKKKKSKKDKRKVLLDEDVAQS